MPGSLHRFAMLFVAWLLLCGCASAADAVAQRVPVPALNARVTDQTGTLDPTQVAALEAKLAALESAKGAQVAVLIVPSTAPETIEQYSIRVVDAWKLGRKGVDDGVLVLVAKDDRKLRIEVGRGLEGSIPDAIANRIIDGTIEPKFKNGDYAGGLDDGVDRLIGLVNGEPLPQPPSTQSDVASASVAKVALLPIPPLIGHVVNQTDGVLTEAQARALEAKLAAFEKNKGRRIAVLLVEGTGDETDAQFADRVFKTWKLGDDGVLVTMTQQPYDERIEVGRGLFAVFPHAVILRILNEDMSWPNVKLGDIAGEINAGVDRIIRLENGEAMPPPPKPESSYGGQSLLEMCYPPPLGSWLGMIVGLPFIFLVVSGLLSWKGALLRGVSTSAAIGVFLLLIGSGYLFALCLAALAFYLGVLNKSDGPEPDWNSLPSSSSHGSSGRTSGGSIAWSILGGIAGGVLSSAGGGGFRGGGGGFSGGGASGSW
ncbi:MAG TPA: TPM domain-containing protein [Xanthomonadaceae bacterium]